MTVAVEVTRGFTTEHRTAVALLYDEAFGAKLGIAIPDRSTRLAVLTSALTPDFCFVALSGGEVLGVAGFKTSAGAFTGGFRFSELRTRLGWVGAMRALAVLALFERAVEPGVLLMDGICVAESARGRGIGTALLDRLRDFARQEGMRALRLDVIDTNPEARRLYERLGFVATRSTRVEFLRGLLGFGSVTTMMQSLTSDSRAL